MKQEKEMSHSGHMNLQGHLGAEACPDRMKSSKRQNSDENKRNIKRINTNKEYLMTPNSLKADKKRCRAVHFLSKETLTHALWYRQGPVATSQTLC